MSNYGSMISSSSLENKRKQSNLIFTFDVALPFVPTKSQTHALDTLYYIIFMTSIVYLDSFIYIIYLLNFLLLLLLLFLFRRRFHFPFWKDVRYAQWQLFVFNGVVWKELNSSMICKSGIFLRFFDFYLQPT